MSFVENSQEIQDGTRRQIEEKGTVRWRSAFVKVAAYTTAWSIVAAGVSSQFDAVGFTEEKTQDVLNVQQSDRLADVRIAEQVKAAVRRDPDVRTVDVVIFVSDGAVTLSGTVLTPHQKSQAEQLASQVEGVVAVVNHITVSDGKPIR